MRFLLLASALLLTAPAQAQVAGTPDQLAATPVVRVSIQENLRLPPDEATINVGVEGRKPTAVAALAEAKAKVERLVAAIRAAGIAERDIQTEGVNISADYRYEQVGGVGRQQLVGYVASNQVRIKTRRIDRLSQLLDQLTAAGATNIYGPSFSLADPLPLRREARKRAMARGEQEAAEYATNAGFSRVRLLSVEEGISSRSSDIVVTGSRLSNVPPPPPPAPMAERGGGYGQINPGQIEVSVVLTLVYRMER